jgi:aminoglycoside phosphotransferase (APT) family kinase protein
MHDVSVMPERLAAFLSIRDGARTASVEHYEPLVGGYSRLMARARITWSDGAVDTLVLRGDPPPGRAMIETDRDLEWALLARLGELDAVPMPAAHHYDDTGEHLATKCIVLEHVEGVSLQALLTRDTDSAEHARHMRDLVDTLATVHAVEPEQVAGVIDAPPDWDTYMGGLIDRFRQAEAAHVEANPFLRYVAAWLDAHRPPPLPLRLVHSDFQASNVMVDAGGRHLLIDWELAHIGDPREDLGYYNVYSSSSGPNLFLADPEGFLARYRERTGFGEDAVNMQTMAYFSSLAAITVYSQILRGAGAMALGQNGGLMTTYTINALTVGHGNFLAGCALPDPDREPSAEPLGEAR